MSGELDGRVAIVTGGSSGIGLGTVERFLAEGARVVVADIDRDRGQAVVADLGKRLHSLTPTWANPTRSSPWWPSPSSGSAVWTS